MISKNSYHILRVGMAITFLWIGILILKSPESWGGYVQPWAVRILPFSVTSALLMTAALDIGIGILLLIDWQSWVAGLLASLHLISVLTVSGITDVTVRDIGLFAGSMVIIIESLPMQIRIYLLKLLKIIKK